jgi:hypothetical protein
MSIKARLIKIESMFLAKTEPVRIAYFVVAPRLEPTGYVCGDVRVIRKWGESVADLQKRCKEAVNWSEGNTLHVFEPQVEVI